jgi:hypothetical protein
LEDAPYIHSRRSGDEMIERFAFFIPMISYIAIKSMVSGSVEALQGLESKGSLKSLINLEKACISSPRKLRQAG